MIATTLSGGTPAEAILIRFNDRNQLLDTLPRGMRAVEVGVQAGDFSQEILTRMQPARLWLVDCWQHQEIDAYMPDHANVAQKEQDALYQEVTERFRHRDDVRIIRKFSPAAALEDFGENNLEFVYLDACHLHDHVLADMCLWWTRLKPGGLLAGHDYVEGISFIQTVSAVNAFCALLRVRLCMLTSDHFASWVIRKPVYYAG